MTDGGLVFVAATSDRRFRAFDRDTGNELWSAELPASGFAAPATYLGRKTGRQFVVIAAGGGNKYDKAFSGQLVAFALPASSAVTPRVLLAAGLLAVVPLSRGGWRGGGAPQAAERPYVPREEPLPGPEVRQPVLFSHRVHAVAARLECLDCHGGATQGDAATIPQAEACLVCHASLRTESPEVAKLATAAARASASPGRASTGCPTSSSSATGSTSPRASLARSATGRSRRGTRCARRSRPA